MRPILLMLALAMLTTAGCVAGQRTTDQDVLLDCRRQADEVVKARYTPPWDESVRQCMEKQAQ